MPEPQKDRVGTYIGLFIQVFSYSNAYNGVDDSWMY